MDPARFLLVDDNAAVSRALTRIARPYGEPVVAATAREAERTALQAPDWRGFVLDVQLPDGSGLDLLARLRQTFPTTAALMLTAHAAPEMINRAYDLNALYVVKPAIDGRLERFLATSAAPEPPASLSERVERVVRTSAVACQLTEAEADVLGRSALGESRGEIADARGTSEETVRTQIGRMLVKTGHGSLFVAVGWVLREVARGSG